jgi:SAM-dependent methyltransferase
VLKQPEEIQGAYSDTGTAEEYVDKRFTSAWGSVVHAAQVKVVNDVIRTHGVKRALELAPGPARVTRDVVGLERGYLCEFNDSMLRVARRRLAGAAVGWQIVRGDAFHLPFRPLAGLDLVYSFRFIRHFEADHRAALYREVRSVLKDGGLFVFDVVNVKVGLPAQIRDGRDKYPIFDEFYTPDALKAELTQHGFMPLSLTDVIRHMRLQQRIQVLVDPRANALARRLISLLEYVPGQPLEWVAVCRKMPQ